MVHMKRVYISALLFALAAVPSMAAAATIGEPIPAFKLPELSDTGTQYSIDDFKGKVVLLTVWASWCGPCLARDLSKTDGRKIRPA